ncbi:CotS family spore coat protein [Natranaerovirga hydrolytica]|uniref:CotS family spore coat protein n=1 Tax=Natranaerovirga hydrolytica TaxID=680378 RepID=UPI001403403B|nr:CotS family spore coat protein [Natranaerovirga hydrolytica]
MIENINGIMEKYGFKVKAYHRGRGSFICETDKGIKLLKEMETTVNKTWFSYYVKKHLINNDYNQVDQYILMEDKPYYEEKDKKYIVKNWFEGRECNLYDEKETLLAVKNLAKLHKTLQYVSVPEDKLQVTSNSFTYNLKKHNKELKRVRKYIRNKSRYADFDILFLKNFMYYYEKAKESVNNFEELDYNLLIREANTKTQICHNDYNQHNALLVGNKMMTVNFEKSVVDLQILDLYKLIRKVMEKNNWYTEYGMKMIYTYDQCNTINQKQLKVLYNTLLYPEKFWKISNYYYNSKKSWEPKISLEKLQKIIHQQESKNQFLKVLKDQM